MGEDNNFTVSLEKVIRDLGVEVTYSATNIGEILIETSDVNRPGLPVAGFFDYFDNSRIQILGKVECTYLENMTSEQRCKSFEELFKRDIPALVNTRGLELFPEMMEMARKYDTTVLTSQLSTSAFMSELISYLCLELAPRITRHGVLVEVYGEGILILGESGVGKSETAMELVKRGHRLVADDAVEIKRASSRTLVGTSPDNIRHFIELRGIGIINVRRIFGMGSVKDAEKIDMIINLENWKDGKHYDRLGLDEKFTNILGNDIPSVTIPVKPGRNLAIIVEVAAMNNRQKRMGYNAAEELNKRLMGEMGENF